VAASGRSGELFLGVDAGGTKTEWALTDADGSVVSAGVARGAQAAAGLDAAAALLGEVLAAAGARTERSLARAVAGVAGAGSAEVRAALRARLEPALCASLHLCGDPEVAAATALAGGPGVAVWSGTGSFAVARTEAGALIRVGGRGYLLSDAGSAYDMARRAAAAAVAAADGLGRATLLGDELAAACGLRDPRDLGRCLQQRAPAELAALFPIVARVAAAGDAAARAVLEDGARALAALAQAAARAAGLPAGALCVVAGGGVFTGVAAMRESLARHLPGARLSVPARSGAEGAALLARAIERREHPLCAWVER
jgi:N-acetylglucosamine kinase-like BadF-type ATPase